MLKHFLLYYKKYYRKLSETFRDALTDEIS